MFLELTPTARQSAGGRSGGLKRAPLPNGQAFGLDNFGAKIIKVIELSKIIQKKVIVLTGNVLKSLIKISDYSTGAQKSSVLLPLAKW